MRAILSPQCHGRGITYIIKYKHKNIAVPQPFSGNINQGITGIRISGILLAGHRFIHHCSDNILYTITEQGDFQELQETSGLDRGLIPWRGIDAKVYYYAIPLGT
jgi:hypothetical protein